MYQNQFQKYAPSPFEEQDIAPHVVSDEGAIMSQPVVHAAMRRSVGQIFYTAGFEEFQPSALETITDLALDYFSRLARSLNEYLEMPRVAVAWQETVRAGVPASLGPAAAVPREVRQAVVGLRPLYTAEEALLQTLAQNSIDLRGLEAYVREEADKLTAKLAVLHERMKAHLAELLRPALLEDGGEGGVNAFADGSDQFVGGDFAEDLDEDFFGFKDLGLDKEFGLASLSVPLHLLQNRMHAAYQSQNTVYVSFVPFPPLMLSHFTRIAMLTASFLPTASPIRPHSPCPTPTPSLRSAGPHCGPRSSSCRPSSPASWRRCRRTARR